MSMKLISAETDLAKDHKFYKYPEEVDCFFFDEALVSDEHLLFCKKKFFLNKNAKRI